MEGSVVFKNRVGEQFPGLRWRYDLLALFLLALFVRGIVLWTSVGQLGAEAFLTLTPDTKNYLDAARALLAHSGAGERILFTFGPGFPYLLSIYLTIFGEGAVPFLILQIVASSATCLLIYKLSRQLLDDYFVSIVAGVIAALSLTSVSLSCLVLSDSLYLFVFALSLVLLLDGLASGGWWRFVLSGILLGGAVLTRSIGQFWPLVLMLIGLLVMRRHKIADDAKQSLRRLRLRQIATSAIICVGVTIGWVVRNGSVNDVYALAMTGAGGPANVAAMTLERQTGVPYREIESAWYLDSRPPGDNRPFTPAEEFRLLQTKTAEVISNSPFDFLTTYANQSWENLTEPDYLHLDLVPKLKPESLHLIETFNRGHVFIWLSLAGLAVLFWRRKTDAAIILGLTLVYYASLVGFTKWQGSRLFYPGLVPGAILCAAVIVTTTRMLAGIVDRMGRRWNQKLGGDQYNSTPADDSRTFMWGVVIVMITGLTLLFREFIFSDQMLKSVDVLGLGLPHHRFLWEHVTRVHSFPGWNPYAMGGVPFIEAISGAVFYPLAIIDYFGYVPRMIGFNFLIHFVLAGLFAYLAARQLKLSPVAAFVTGIAYAFSPLILSWVAPGHDGKIYCATLFPLLVLFADRLSRDSRVIDMVLLGFVLACMVVTPHLQMVVYAGLYVGGHIAFRLASEVVLTRSLNGLGQRLLLLAGALVLGLLLSAVQWLPSLNYIPNDSPRAYEQAGVEYATTYSFHPEELISIALPEFCGLDEVDGPKTYWGRNSFKDNSESFGALTCLLAFFGLLLPGDRKRFWWLAVIVIAALYAVGTTTPLFGVLLSVVPILGKFRAPSTVMFVGLFAVAVLAGIGVGKIQSILDSDPKGGKRLVTTLVSLVAVVFILAILMLLKGRGFLGHYSDAIYPSLQDSSPRSVRLQERMLENLPYLQAAVFQFGLWISALVGVILVYLRCRRSWIIGIGIAVLLTVSTGMFASRCVKVIDPSVYYEPKPVTNFLREHVGIDRAIGFALNQSSYLVGSYPIQSTIGFHSRAVKWYYRLTGEEPARNLLHARFANLAGTKYIIFPNRPDYSLNLDTLGPIRMDTAAVFDDCIVFENLNAFPRVFLVDSFVVMDSCWPAMIETVNGQTDLRHVALLEQTPAIEIHHVDDSICRAAVDYYEDDSVSVSVSCNSNRLLILTDTWYSAWQAFVDGKPTEILRVDGAFRAVPVPAGSRRVDFAFHSPCVRAGAVTSLTTLSALAAFGLGALILRRTRKQKPPHF